MCINKNKRKQRHVINVYIKTQGSMIVFIKTGGSMIAMINRRKGTVARDWPPLIFLFIKHILGRNQTQIV